MPFGLTSLLFNVISVAYWLIKTFKLVCVLILVYQDITLMQ